jgi:hypothetical protein
MTPAAAPRFPQLQNFHYGYLGEDWQEDYGDVERAITDYLSGEETPVLIGTVKEAEELSLAPDFEEICRQLTQYFRPTNWTLNDLHSWIDQLRARAQGEIDVRAHPQGP